MGYWCGANRGTNVAPVVTERPLMPPEWLQRFLVVSYPRRIDVDHGDCDECGFPFTWDEWDERHHNHEGDDVHANCCAGCDDDDQRRNNV